VIEDIRSHFQDSLGIELQIFDGGHERQNLHYEVMAVTKPEKQPLIHRLLETGIRRRWQTDRQGGAVVFAAKRKHVEEISGFLRDMGWPARTSMPASMRASRRMFSRLSSKASSRSSSRPTLSGWGRQGRCAPRHPRRHSRLT
jgi:superfamily II DNA helicase RecQ